jgi:4-amino-4-deoxy-L-arabinose transferase-like glycosyltransferase
MDRATAESTTHATPMWARVVVLGVSALGIALMVQAAMVSSATYDEVAYLRIASEWWRRGETSEITRMGSPLTFFKLQAAPAFFVLDHIGLGGLIDRPIVDQASLLPIVRMAGLWIWLVAFGLTAAWSRRLYGPRAMAFAAVLFALSPNLLAHGSLMTMEMPLIAATVGVFFLFWNFLRLGDTPSFERGKWFVASAVVAGLAFSCKFTAVVYPPILGLIWALDVWRRGERNLGRIVRAVGLGMVGYVVVLLAADWAITGFATLTPSPTKGFHPSSPTHGWLLETPLPQDWVGFATQVRHQRNGGPSYLLGERRMTGWWYYYPVALAVKMPLGCWLLILARCALRRVRHADPTRDCLLPLAIAAFLALAMFGSKRNYGVRYLLPMAPLAIVWISALAERMGIWRWIVGAGLIGQVAALATIHPHELSYFNVLAGGKVGGRRVLADSNLDWGQGLRSFARLERQFGPMTLFYFGEGEPVAYGIESMNYLFTANDTGKSASFDSRSIHWPNPQPERDPILQLEHLYLGYSINSAGEIPDELSAWTRYIAVSASLQHGPWGPEGYFQRLDLMEPVAFTDDGTIAVYDLKGTDLLRDPPGCTWGKISRRSIKVSPSR